MSAATEYRGLRALEYAAQTGAQLMCRRPLGKPPLAIDVAVAQALWSLGAEAQIFCNTVDHRALAASEPRPSLVRASRYVLRRLARRAELEADALRRRIALQRTFQLAFLLVRAWRQAWRQVLHLRPGARVT